MSYQRAEKVLPDDLVEIIQKYIDGECIYIPRRDNERRKWGENSNIREELAKRNDEIYSLHKEGANIAQIAEQFYLSEKSVQRIIREMKKAA